MIPSIQVVIVSRSFQVFCTLNMILSVLRSFYIFQNGPGTVIWKSYRGIATCTQKRICVYIWTKNMERIYHNSDEFLMLCVQNMCVEPILISLNPILTEFVMMFVSPPHHLTQS